MDLTRNLEPTERLYPSPSIAAGNVYVGTKPPGGNTTTPELKDGEKAVLQTQDGSKLELTTRAKIDGNPGVTGTYLNSADYYSLKSKDDPKLRLYTRADMHAKVRSWAGIVLLAPALLALLSAIASIVFLLTSQSQPSTTAVAAQAQAIVSWASQPGTARASTAQACLLRIEGQQAPQATIPGVTCAPPPTTHWWQSTLTGPICTAVIAFLAALIGIVSLPGRYTFHGNPAAGR
jgi:hypothetical protein